MSFTFGVLLPPVSREFGWDRGTVSFAIVLGLWMTGIATPVVGRLVDRFGIRAVALPAITLFSIATASVSLVPASIAAFAALYALMGLAAAGQTPLIYAKAISARFDDKRGLALGVAMAGVGLGAAIVPQFAQAMVGRVGWRGAYAGLGGLIFLLAFPAVALVIGRQPHVITVKTGVVNQAPGLTALEALRTGAFWRLATVFFIVAAATGGTIAHLVPLLTDRGVPPQTATGLLTLAGLSLIGGRLLAGYLLDRIFAPYVALAFLLAPLIGIAVFLLAFPPRVAMVGTLFVGIGLGAEVDLIAFLLSRYLGMRSFGEIYGYFFAIFMLGAGLGPLVMGVSFDRTGAYNFTLVCFELSLVFASILVVRLGPYAYPVSHGPVPSHEEPIAGLTAPHRP